MVFGDFVSKGNPSNRNIKEGSGIIIKLQNGSWGIRTRNYFIILAYSEFGKSPVDRSIACGYLNEDEFMDAKWIYFDMSYHPPKADFSLQGANPLYSMQDRVKGLTFFLNEDFKGNYSGLNLCCAHYPEIGKAIEIEDLKVTVVKAYRKKKGYLIECDGLTIFWLSGLSEEYISSRKDGRVIEFVKKNFPEIDLQFIGTPDGIGPEKGNGIREAYFESIRLNPGAVFFMGKEHLERRVLYQIRSRKKIPEFIHCSDNPGDAFYYNQGDIKKIRTFNFALSQNEPDSDDDNLR